MIAIGFVQGRASPCIFRHLEKLLLSLSLFQHSILLLLGLFREIDRFCVISVSAPTSPGEGGRGGGSGAENHTQGVWGVRAGGAQPTEPPPKGKGKGRTVVGGWVGGWVVEARWTISLEFLRCNRTCFGKSPGMLGNHKAETPALLARVAGRLAWFLCGLSWLVSLCFSSHLAELGLLGYCVYDSNSMSFVSFAAQGSIQTTLMHAPRQTRQDLTHQSARTSRTCGCDAPTPQAFLHERIASPTLHASLDARSSVKCRLNSQALCA